MLKLGWTQIASVVNTADTELPEEMEIYRDQKGDYYRASEIAEFFDGQQWHEWSDDQALVAHGLHPDTLPEDCKRVRFELRILSEMGAATLFAKYMIPEDFQDCLSLSLAPAEALDNAVDQAVATMRLLADKLGQLVRENWSHNRSAALPNGFQQLSNLAADNLLRAAEIMRGHYFAAKQA